MAAAARFKPQELKVARQFLQRLLDKPEEFISHIRQYVLLLDHVLKTDTDYLRAA